MTAATDFLRAENASNRASSQKVTLELAGDFREIIGNLTDEEFMRFLENTIQANGASNMSLEKNAYLDSAGSPRAEYTLVLNIPR